MESSVNDESLPCLLVTANVGSVFEDPSRLLLPWLKEFLTKVTELQPKFLALHMQEVGGKTYEKSMEYVQEFIKNLCAASELNDYNVCRIYLDEDFNTAEHFTALGNVYFSHKSIKSLKIWNFLSHEWEKAEGKNIHTGSIEAIATKEKAKFPQHFFPECKWSRKGFMRTRWELNGTVLDFINIHLFHDASNLAACEEFPSVYCKTRRRALIHTLERFHLDCRNGVAPYFIFGDFNFRLDQQGLVKKLTEHLTTHRIQSVKNDSTKLQFRNSLGDNVLTVGKKEFTHNDHQSTFKEEWMKEYDREMDPLLEILTEYPIKFPPTYPYEEEPELPSSYMSTRCPAWCDRILLSPTIQELIDEERELDYSIIGESICMGDHKPVYLNIQLKSQQGTIRCCSCFEHAKNNYNLLRNNILKTSNANDHQHPVVVSLPPSVHCPHSKKIFQEILLECNKLDQTNRLSPSLPANTINAANKENQITNLPSSQNRTLILHQPSNLEDQPMISINVIDSDNLNICMCSLMSEGRVPSPDFDIIDGSICPECRNIIKQQPQEHRCTLVSKRLLLSNNIIVNRIDTHYLNTYLDTRGEPYTPESVDSHTPYPEYETQVSDEEISEGVETEEDQQSTNLNNEEEIGGKKSPAASETRGVLSPGDLKSRLEDLQRNSLNEINADFDDLFPVAAN
ncbi:INPP5A family protein [Megaselia abdita]